MPIGRIVASFFVLAASWFLNAVWSPQVTLISSAAAGHQFEASDTAYLSVFYTMQAVSMVTYAIGLIALITLITIWYRPVRSWITTLTATMMFALILTPHPADAYFDTTDKTEAYTILPNQSAFWIPNSGNNKDNQAQFNSEDYYNANKVATKLFQIPHAKLTGSAGNSFFSGWDDYVPTGRLIIVDRTPQSREWVRGSDRGTSTRDDSFPCQSKEGLNISVGVSIGTTVTEVNAAKFLYNFGVSNPAGNPGDPAVIFTSVYYGRSLADVMDDVVRKEVQTLVCDQIAARTFDDDNASAVQIMGAVQKAANDYLASVGITLNFIGWADTFTFDDKVQDAINRNYVAQQDAKIGAELQPYANVIQAIAVASAIRAWGEHADGKFPTTVVGYPPDVGGMLNTLLHSVAPAAGK